MSYLPSRSLPALCFLLLLAACSPGGSNPSAVESADTYFPVQLAKVPLRLQMALTEAEQARGLMFRDPLPEDHGMLFVFEKPGPRSFWMRNTKIPLDLGYFDASGRLLETHALFPYDETSVPSRSTKVQFVLEMNRGAFERLDFRPGDILDLSAVAEAIEARGLRPDAFGL